MNSLLILKNITENLKTVGNNYFIRMFEELLNLSILEVVKCFFKQIFDILTLKIEVKNYHF